MHIEDKKDELENSAYGEFNITNENVRVAHIVNPSSRPFAYTAGEPAIKDSIKLAGRLPHGVLSQILKGH